MLSSVRVRIIGGFAFLCLILAVVASASAWQERVHRSDLNELERHSSTATLLQEAEAQAGISALLLQRYVIAGDDAYIVEIQQHAAAAVGSLTAAVSQGAPPSVSDIAVTGIALSEGAGRVSALRQSGDIAGAEAAMEEIVPVFREFRLGLEDATTTERQEVFALRNNASRAGDLALSLLIGSALIGAVLGVVVSGFIARSILRPLSSLESTALAVAGGDLEARATATGPSELAHLGSALNQMTDSLLDASKRRELEEALKQSEERLHTVVASTPIVMFALDREGVFTLSEGKGLDALGLKPGQVVGQSVFDVYRDSPEILENVNRALAGEEFTAVVEVAGLVFESWYSPIRDENGEPNGGIGVATDITERSRAQEEIRSRERYFRSLIENTSDIIIVLNDDGTIRYISPSSKREIGYDPEELIGRSAFEEILHPEDRARGFDTFATAVQNPDVAASMAVRVRHKDGSWHDFEGTVRNLLGDPAVDGLVLNCRDITERKRAEETIKHLAYHDALTSLPNRTLFEDRLRIALSQARRNGQVLAVLFLDLDRFKNVNDAFGHSAGDVLLQRVGDRLTTVVRDCDTVSRVGGDEFTILLSEVGGQDRAVEVAKRVLECCRKPWLVRGHEFHATVSIGMAFFPDDGEDTDSLLRNADTAMYRAKENGRDNLQLYRPAMNARIVERLAVEESLRNGLERGEFVVHYQPQVEIDTGRIVGAEALVRWQHRERGLVLPGEFIAAAEETGLIVPLGEWVLRTACAQSKAWHEAGLPQTRIAVNLSAPQFQQPNLISLVEAALEDSTLDPNYLQLEITEGIAMQDADFSVALLQNLRKMGVQIAIDDFGTGYSSLSYLKRFPINIVKIDRSFVRDLAIDSNDAAIVTTIIAMAHTLNLKVIAEGVETEEQLTFLKDHQCDEFQGFLFSKAVPAEKLEKMLAPKKRRSRPKVTA